MIVIDRCQCFQHSFVRLKDVAKQTGCKTIPDLQNYIEFGKNCALCHPYVKRMLETGETVFYEILVSPSDID